MALKDTNANLAELASRCSALEAANKALRLDIAEDLKTALAGALHEIQDSIHVPVNGKDGVSIQGERGDKGIAGHVLTITAKDERDIRLYARQIRKHKLVQHANRLERLDNAMRENYGRPHRGLLGLLGLLKQEIADLGDVE